MYIVHQNISNFTHPFSHAYAHLLFVVDGYFWQHQPVTMAFSKLILESANLQNKLSNQNILLFSMISSNTTKLLSEHSISHKTPLTVKM